LNPFIRKTVSREVTFAGTLFRTALKSNNPFRRPRKVEIEGKNGRQLGELDTGKEVMVSIFRDDTMKGVATVTNLHSTLARLKALAQWINFKNLDTAEYKGHGAIKLQWSVADTEQLLSYFSPNRPRKLRKAIDTRHANNRFQELSYQVGKPLISKFVRTINKLPANRRPNRVMGLNVELDCFSSVMVQWRERPLLLTYDIGDQKYEWVFRFFL
jgi:hypothetical protein